MNGRFHGGAGHDVGLAHLSDLAAVRGWDAAAGVYDCAEGKAVIAEWLPLVGCDAGGIRALTGLAEEVMRARGTLQVVNQASPHIGDVLEGWQHPRRPDRRNGAGHGGSGHGDAGHGDAGHGDAGMGAARMAMFAAAAAHGVAGRRWRPRHYRVLVVIRVPDGTHDALLTTLAQRLAETATMLGTQSRRVPPEALLALLTEMLAPRIAAAPARLSDWNPLEPLNGQLHLPGHTLRADFTGLTFTRPAPRNSGGNSARGGAPNNDAGDAEHVRARVYTLSRLPDHWPPGAAAALIGDVFRPHLFCGWPVTLSLTVSAAEVNRDAVALRLAKKDRAAGSMLRYVMPMLGHEAADLRQLNDALAEGEGAARVLNHVLLHAPAHEFGEAEAALTGLFAASGIGIAPEHGLHLAGLATLLPAGGFGSGLGAMIQMRRARTLLLRNAACLMPLFGEWRGNAHGHAGTGGAPPVLLLTGRRGQPAGWTPWAGGGNHNVAIVGVSGEGKSVFMQDMMAGVIATGGSAIVIDDGGSFRDAAAMLGGTWVDFGDAGLRINPFAAIGADDDGGAGDGGGAGIDGGDEDANAMLVAFMAALAHPARPVTDLERALLGRAVQTVRRMRGADGTIDDVIGALRDDADGSAVAGELATLLAPFAADGPGGARFSGGCSVRLDARLTVFEMARLRERPEILAAAMVLLMHLTTRRMYLSPRDHRVALMIDEAWTMLRGASAEFVEGVARRARKYNGALVCATQGVDEFFRNASAEAAWSTSDWTVFFRQRDSSIAALRREGRIDLEGDPVLERALRSLASVRDVYSEMVIHGPGGWDIHRLLLDDVSLAAYSSTGEDVAAVEAMIASGMTHAAALAELAHRKRRGRGEAGGSMAGADDTGGAGTGGAGMDGYGMNGAGAGSSRNGDAVPPASASGEREVGDRESPSDGETR